MNKIFITTLITLLLTVGSSFAEDPQPQTLKVGDTFKVYELEDAHRVKHSLKPETRLIIMSFEMDLSKSIHAWLEKKDPNFLQSYKAEYVADITEMPGIITYLFARPKMQKYPFQILLADDENFGPTFPKEEGKFVVFEIDENKIVKNISYYATPEEMEKKHFSPPAAEVTKEEVNSKK